MSRGIRLSVYCKLVKQAGENYLALERSNRRTYLIQHIQRYVSSDISGDVNLHSFELISLISSYTRLRVKRREITRGDSSAFHAELWRESARIGV